MADKRTKTTMSKVNKEIAPYVKVHLFGKSTIDANNLSKVSLALLPKYNNVEIIQAREPGVDGKPYMKITVKETFGTKEQIFIITGKLNKKGKQKDSVAWVDDIEDYLAAIEDD